MTHTASAQPPVAPPLILIIPAARVDALPAPVTAIINQCESAYSGGRWFVIVPADLYLTWPQEEAASS